MERVHAASSWNTRRPWGGWQRRAGGSRRCADGSDGAAAGVEVRPWHRGGIKDHPWHELRHREATTALAVAVVRSEDVLLAAAPKHRTLARDREDVFLASY